MADRTPPVFAGLMSAVTCIPGPSGGPTRLEQLPAHVVTGRRQRHAAGAIEYDIYMANTPARRGLRHADVHDDAGATAFSTPQLPDDRAYYFVVRARDRAGNEDRGTVERRGTNLCL